MILNFLDYTAFHVCQLMCTYVNNHICKCRIVGPLRTRLYKYYVIDIHNLI